MRNINKREYYYYGIIKGNYRKDSFPTEVKLCMKEGAQVMFVKNDPNKKWVNGTLGEIHSLSGNFVKVRIENDVYRVEREIWEVIEYYYDRNTGKIEAQVVGSFEQYPLKLAWAITIHKSQGKTFDKMIIDLGAGAFAHGQLYVALSRCKTLDGIILRKPVNYRDIILDQKIVEFLSNFN